ncbi:MAG: type II secretion system protein [Myxococcales bacterium]
MKRRPTARGFTLIELGAVLAVTAILAAAIVPDFIESARNKMAQKAATDIATIHDAARWFYAQSYQADPTRFGGDLGRWPGQTEHSTCQDRSPPNEGIKELFTTHYLPTFPLNPWGKPYEARVFDSGHPIYNGTARWGCSFEVGTDVPRQVTNTFLAFLPSGDCNTGQPTPPCFTTTPQPVGGPWVRCCSVVPPPGAGWCQTPVGQTTPRPRIDPTDGRLKCR